MSTQGVQPAAACSGADAKRDAPDGAVTRLSIDNEWVGFTARFGGVSQPVLVPMGAVLAIYARETGQGMALPEDPQAASPEEGPEPPPTPDDGAPRRSHLRVVK